MRRSCCSAALLAAVAGLLVLPAMLGPVAPPVLWNLSASVPEGLYVRAGDRLAGGGLAAVCLPADLGRFARQRGYVSRGRCPGDAAPLFKRLAARAGQEIDYLDASIWIDGRPLAVTTIRQLDRKGRPLPLARAFPYRLALGEVFLLGEDPFSFDSRYFGPLPETAVLGIYRPLWILGGPHHERPRPAVPPAHARRLRPRGSDGLVGDGPRRLDRGDPPHRLELGLSGCPRKAAR